LPYLINDQNVDRYPLISFSQVHDIAIIDVKTIEKAVYVGWVVHFNVTIRNNGDFVENFTLMLYCNETLVASKDAENLAVRANATENLVWDTSDLKPCSLCTVRVEANLLTEDADLENNTWIALFETKMLGDVDGNGMINILDVATIAYAFGAHFGEDRYRLNYDMNMDEVINIIDISAAARNFGLSC